MSQWIGRTILVLSILGTTLAAQTPLTTVRVASGLAAPLYVTAPPGDLDRLFILEQNTSRILILELDTGVVKSTAFLNLSAKTSVGGERGLLGLAFHPDYASNGFFYVNYTDTGGDTMIERYSVSANPDLADAASAMPILGPITQPFSNHNGGCIQFGPDGYLYIGMGDGGSFQDPGCRAQQGNTLLGKMLRIDVDGGSPYAIPADNPFVGDPGVLDEIWATGLRNPWRFSFDRLTGDMYIGDVGQDLREEVDFEPSTSPGGRNYGWKVMEGFRCNSTTACPVGTAACNDPVYTLPIKQYTHGLGCSISGGYLYRGCAIPDLQGTYFYADYCSSTIWSFEYDGATRSNDMDRTAELAPGGGLSINAINSFGEDGRGELYIVDQGGEIFRVVANQPSQFKDLGFGKVGSNGQIPELSGCGLLDAGNSAEILLRRAPASTVAALVVSLQNNPTPGFGGTVVPIPPLTMALVVTDTNGQFLASVPGGGGPVQVFLQALVADPGATSSVAISNALQLSFP